ncbi:DUF2179 domain-containing protein [Arenibacter latericius]|uniref:DUF2179 domain-containing protein n=1 Tax=Arenibacter latericius TaxID=86104 RepID=UPI0004235A66|nr:DUF2179 domain-containing protein [Arenibacter latericius]MDX1365450.1 DUF2179 domain-containing protein [Arenibacter latericius]
MEQFFYDNFGVTEEVLNYVIIPLLIFFARIGDVSISTIRIIFVMAGKRSIAPILGFFEALIWLLAIGQIISNIDNVFSYLAYASGFAAGTYVGMYIEERLALGRVVLRLITKEPVHQFLDFLKENDYRYSMLDGEGSTGKVNVVFLVLKRDRLNHMTEAINKYHPNAFYTIEGVKMVNEADLADEVPRRINFRRLQLKRK